jgi:serine/threonine protein kinase
MDLKRMLGIASEMAAALAAPHPKGLVHRDITPGNIFVSEDGNVKILDFGLLPIPTEWIGGGPLKQRSLSPKGSARRSVAKVAEHRAIVSVLVRISSCGALRMKIVSHCWRKAGWV